MHAYSIPINIYNFEDLFDKEDTYQGKCLILNIFNCISIIVF